MERSAGEHESVLSLAAVVVLWRLRVLTLDTAIAILPVTMLLQLGWAHRSCRLNGLVPGKACIGLIRPLAIYGLAQMRKVTPTAINADLDQLISPKRYARRTLAVMRSQFR